MSFQQGLSGLNAAAKGLDAVSNNVSNAGTVGFKGASAQFADVFAASIAGGGSGQISIGVNLAQVKQAFTQGNISVTNNPLEVAINGGGSFRLTAFPSGREKIDIGDYYGDYSKIHAQLGWQPGVDLRAGIARTLAYYREHRAHYWNNA